MMKRLLVLLIAFGFTAAAHGQGKILFANKVEGVVDAPVLHFDWTGTITGGPGPDYSAQLFLVNPNSTITALTPITTFAARGPSGTEDRYLIPQVVDVLAEPGMPLNFQLRAWRTSEGRWEQAADKGIAPIFSAIVGSEALPGNLKNLQPFGFGIFPEPSAIALGVLGAAVFVIHRKTKRRKAP